MGMVMAARRLYQGDDGPAVKRGPPDERSAILNELCALTGWHHDHARKAFPL